MCDILLKCQRSFLWIFVSEDGNDDFWSPNQFWHSHTRTQQISQIMSVNHPTLDDEVKQIISSNFAGIHAVWHYTKCWKAVQANNRLGYSIDTELLLITVKFNQNNQAKGELTSLEKSNITSNLFWVMDGGVWIDISLLVTTAWTVIWPLIGCWFYSEWNSNNSISCPNFYFFHHSPVFLIDYLWSQSSDIDILILYYDAKCFSKTRKINYGYS